MVIICYLLLVLEGCYVICYMLFVMKIFGICWLSFGIFKTVRQNYMFLDFQ